MTHLPFIAASYTLALLLFAWLGLGASLRLSRARRKLALVDPRAGRMK